MKKTCLMALVVLLCGCVHIYRIPADIFKAVEINDWYYVDQYLKSGGDPNAVDDQGRSLLDIASGPHGGREVLELLLKAGATRPTSLHLPISKTAILDYD